MVGRVMVFHLGQGRPRNAPSCSRTRHQEIVVLVSLDNYRENSLILSEKFKPNEMFNSEKLGLERSLAGIPGLHYVASR